VAVTSGDWVYVRNHSRKHKLDPEVKGLYEVLKTDGRTYLVDQDGKPYCVSGDHLVPAGSVGPASRPARPQVAVPDALQPGRSEYVFERFVEHTFYEEGVLWLLAGALDLARRTTPGNTWVVYRFPWSIGIAVVMGSSRRVLTRQRRGRKTNTSKLLKQQ